MSKTWIVRIRNPETSQVVLELRHSSEPAARRSAGEHALAAVPGEIVELRHPSGAVEEMAS